MRIGRTGAAMCAFLLLDSAAFCATKPFEKVGVQLHNATTFPRGVRNIGMGGTGVADVSGFSTGYFNPASFAWSDAIALGASTSDWMEFAEFSEIRLSGSYPMKGAFRGADLRLGGSLGYSQESLSLGSGTTIYRPDGTTLVELDNPDYYLSGSLAARAKKGIWELALGGTWKYLFVSALEHYTTWAFDLGFIGAVDLARADGFGIRPRIGAGVRNLGQDIEYISHTGYGYAIDQPGEQRYGIGVDLFTPAIASMSDKLHRDVSAGGVSLDFDIVKGYGSNDADGWAFGAEVSFFEAVSVRAGRSKDVFFSVDCTTYGAGLGWDFGRVLFQLDYARMDPSCDACEFLAIHPEEDALGFVLGGRF